MTQLSLILTMNATSILQQNQQTREVIMLLLLIIVSAISLGALVIMLRALFAKGVLLSQQFLERSPWRAFFIGLVNYIFLAAIIAVISATGIEPLNLIAVFILIAVIILTAFGLSGLAQLLGQRIAVLRDKVMSPFSETVWGVTTLIVASLLPVIGWFFIAPVLLIVSFGAAVLGWRNRKTPEPYDRE